jgi:hypothetical protein
MILVFVKMNEQFWGRKGLLFKTATLSFCLSLQKYKKKPCGENNADSGLYSNGKTGNSQAGVRHLTRRVRIIIFF